MAAATLRLFTVCLCRGQGITKGERGKRILLVPSGDVGAPF